MPSEWTAGDVPLPCQRFSWVSLLRQRRCPPEMLGRVSATVRFLIMGLFPLGAFLGGVLGELIGVRATLRVSGGLIVVSALPVHLALRDGDGEPVTGIRSSVGG